MVPSLEDALIGALFNHNVQAVVIRYGFPLRSRHNLEILQRYLSRIGDVDLADIAPEDYGTTLAQLLANLRLELDVYLVTDQSVEEIAGRVGCIAPGSLDTSLSHAAGLSDIAGSHA